MSYSDIHESNVRFHDAWRFFARCSPAGEVLELPEVTLASSNVSWAMMNAAFQREPLESEEALERAATAAARYFVPTGRGWMFALCEDWLSPRLRERAAELLAPHGLHLALVASGMVAERLAPPLRPLPPLDIRRATDSQGRCHIADVNALCYDMPLEVGREAFDVPGLFEGEGQGYVGFHHGEAAASAAVTRVEDVAYVSMVATLPAHRRAGYAEALMRHALAEAHRAWGVERTVLHATPAGLPVYLRMGYRAVTRFHFFMAAPQPR